MLEGGNRPTRRGVRGYHPWEIIFETFACQIVRSRLLLQEYRVQKLVSKM